MNPHFAMSLAEYFTYPYPARTGISVLLPALIFFALGSGVAEAHEVQPSEAKNNSPPVIISAPESLRNLLKTHFQLPAEPVVDDIARATFMRRARQEISELLATEGYFTPALTLQSTPDETPVLEVAPGPRALITEVRIEFKGDLAVDAPERRARIESLRAAWPLRAGDPFRSPAWEEAKAALISSVSRDDYAAAVIDESKAEVDPVSARVRLLVIVDSGPVFHYGNIVIKGLNRYDPKLVNNLAPFKAGDPYRRDQLQAFQTKLQNLAQFGSALVSVEPDVAAHQAAPVEVTLSETQSQRISFGGGYSSNTGARGEINYGNHNFLGRALRFSSLLRLEQKRQSLAMAVDSLPNRAGRWFSLGAGIDRTTIEDLDTLREKVALNRNQLVGKTETRIGINWQREDRDPKGGLHQTNQTLVLDGQLRYRSVDDALFPRDGSVIEFRIGGGSKQLLSDQSFLRTYYRHQYWYPVGKRDVLFLRGEAGYTFADSRFGIPQEYLFRAGGIQSVRGYDFQSLGVQEGQAIVGGTAMVSGTIEYNHWLTREWGAAVFTDAGDAADSLHRLHLAVGYGGGIRWRSPVGPLALDLARGQRDGKLRLHFSIAVAF
ncbi:autotransporter secretion outer membrane protein TamA [Nitrosospira sp. Nsp5]|uniref:Autotransporter secretion outer membrane protein TamA n=2 Tax=Nitrosomonadaceae TaxID=206379 RepID=A0ABY0TCQ8_9PROT|nr:autotransporter secretion outer membrane protein TamA [Nitrosospira sp. Nsp5]SDQ63013.1 autotransporter secretion outer membrane protein TamA [Nitrosospira multiformis]